MSLVYLAFLSLQECPLVPLQFMSNTNSSESFKICGTFEICDNVARLGTVCLIYFYLLKLLT